MERDPDYIDPEVLKRRAAASGGAGAKAGRPKVRRVKDQGVRITPRVAKGFSIAGGKFATPGAKVSNERVRVS